MVRIDGSHGEGGGQILRTALSLSALLGLPVTIGTVPVPTGRSPASDPAPDCRKGVRRDLRRRGGGDGRRFPEDRLYTRAARPGAYFFDVGTARSVTLILQALLLPLTLAPGPSHITLRGGTHVPWSPPYQYLSEVFLPTLALRGIQTAVWLKKWGWYPKGGGQTGDRYSSD